MLGEPLPLQPLFRPKKTRRRGPGAQPFNGAAPAGFSPADLQSAYNLPSSAAGSGQTVAIVDAYDDPHAELDLGTYRAQFGIAACTTANGCFRKVDQTGGSRYPSPDPGWAGDHSRAEHGVGDLSPRPHPVDRGGLGTDHRHGDCGEQGSDAGSQRDQQQLERSRVFRTVTAASFAPVFAGGHRRPPQP